MALVTWPLLVAEMLIFGSVAFALAIAPPDPAARRSLQQALAPFWLLLAVAVLILSLLGLMIEASDMAGVPLAKTFPLLGAVMSQTHVGRLWSWRLGFAVLLVIVAWLPMRPLVNSLSVWGVAMMLLLLGSLSSHAIDHGALAVTAYFLHELAAGVWIGALIGLWFGFARVRLGDRWVARTAPRVSQVAAWSVAMLVLTGVYTAYDALGLNSDHLLYSAYGRTLMLKLALFAIVAAIGGYNRYRLVPEVADSAARTLLMRNIAVESLLLMGVLGVAAFLANTPPAHSAGGHAMMAMLIGGQGSALRPMTVNPCCRLRRLFFRLSLDNSP